MDRADLQQLARMRLREARALLWSGNPCGAYHLAGLVVECALKACIARKTREYEFPDKKRTDAAYSHSAERLVIAAELKTERDAELSANPLFAQYWALAQEWEVDSRYDANITMSQAAELIRAIEDHANGVLRWIERYW